MTFRLLLEITIDGFNTDDGIRRATMPRTRMVSLIASSSFNTDDGIRRATIGFPPSIINIWNGVSIPMTVLGGLQCGIRELI